MTIEGEPKYSNNVKEKQKNCKVQFLIPLHMRMCVFGVQSTHVITAMQLRFVTGQNDFIVCCVFRCVFFSLPFVYLFKFRLIAVRIN